MFLEDMKKKSLLTLKKICQLFLNINLANNKFHK